MNRAQKDVSARKGGGRPDKEFPVWVDPLRVGLPSGSPCHAIDQANALSSRFVLDPVCFASSARLLGLGTHFSRGHAPAF